MGKHIRMRLGAGRQSRDKARKRKDCDKGTPVVGIPDQSLFCEDGKKSPGIHCRGEVLRTVYSIARRWNARNLQHASCEAVDSWLSAGCVPPDWT
jgi:hypothetical protein